MSEELDPRLIDSVSLSLVVPVFNEADTVQQFMERVQEVLPPNTTKLDVVFVNDGSVDGTLQRLLEIQDRCHALRIVDLSRNFGKEAAITAGLRFAKGQVVVPIDADLQDPIEIIPEMIVKWREGYDVVVGRRIDRKFDTWSKRISALWFYRTLNKISSTKIPENVGDFRLIDRLVVDALTELPESQRFMKGLFAWVGFRTAVVEYSRQERIAGKTKFDGWRLWNFALEGITSFSIDPLRIWFYVGGFVSVTSLLFALFMLLKVMVSGIDVPGYASVIVAVTLLGGLQLVGIGILGEYLGRSYMESKRRPVFIVRRVYERGD